MSIFEELGINPEQIDRGSIIGNPAYSEVNGIETLGIPVAYEYKGKTKKFVLTVIPGKQISTVMDKTWDEARGKMDTEIVTYGMERDEVEKFFPPVSATSPYTFNLVGIVRSILFEAFLNKDTNVLTDGNVRGFWYTHLIHMIESVLGLGETDTVKSTINKSWEDLIVSGLVTYEGMKIKSGKSGFTHSTVKDSPFANLLIAVEKEDKFDVLTWIPKLFNCTLITAGGQPSRSNARKFILDLRDKARVDLDQQFYMCVVSDLDPAGYYIQNSFVHQLEKAIEYYGGSGKIEIRRLFVRKDQVTEVLLNHDAVPCYDKAESVGARKAENTKWENFCQVTDGGVYKKVSREVALSLGAISQDEQVGEDSIDIRAKLELNAFPDSIINNSTVEELLTIIVETSDESLIMIPEIMRIFEQERLRAMEEVFVTQHSIQIKPIIEEFLKDIDAKKAELQRKTEGETDVIWREYDATEETVAEPFNNEIEKLKAEADARVPDELAEIEKLEASIAKLKEAHSKVIEDIEEKTADILEKISDVETEREEALEPYQEKRDEDLEDVKDRGVYRVDEIEKFRREKETLFNPLEVSLRQDIEQQMEQDNLEFFFVDLEDDGRTVKHISKLLNNPEALLVEDTPCLNQDYPVFREDDLLHKASVEKSENVEPYRKGFTPDFLDDMKQVVLDKVDNLGFEFEIGEVGEFADFAEELNEVVERIESDINEGVYKEETDEDNEEGESK